MNRKRKQRLIIVLGVLAAVGLSTALITFALRENINLFFKVLFILFKLRQFFFIQWILRGYVLFKFNIFNIIRF